jgi:hypothetical protein
MIDWKKTEERSLTDMEFAKGSSRVSKTTNQKVIWKCDNVNCDAPSDVSEREFVYNYARQKEEKAKKEGKDSLCQVCSHAHRRGKATVSSGKTHLPLPPEADDELTMKEYGYTASSLKPWSRKHIVISFIDEDGDTQIYTPTRAQLNTYKSVKETGHFYPTSWWTKQRRTGSTATDETKRLMRESQKRRRDNEKDDRKELERFFKNKLEEREKIS